MHNNDTLANRHQGAGNGGAVGNDQDGEQISHGKSLHIFTNVYTRVYC